MSAPPRAVRVAVVIVNYRSYPELRTCLAALERNATGTAVVVVDQESDTAAGDSIEASFPHVQLLRRPGNQGFAAGVNRGAREAHAPYLLLLNPDTIVEPNLCAWLADWLDAHPEVGVAGPRLRNDDGTIQASARRFPDCTTAIAGRSSWLTRALPGNRLSRRNLLALDAAATAPLEVDWVSGACMMIRRDAFDAVGGMDEGFFLYWEDADFCRRVARAGWRADANTLYAATWQRTRRKWSDPRVEPGQSETGLWKTTDAGKTWQPINEGLPAARFRGRIGIDVSRSNPNVLYAFVDNYEPGRAPLEGEHDAYGRRIAEARIKSAEIYRTDDKGLQWRKVSLSSEQMTRHSGTYGWVFGQIRIDPTDEDTIYSLGIDLNVSRDGGKSFTQLRGMHADHHGLWIDPQKPSTLLNANDGGFYSSVDGGKTWTFAVQAGGAQFGNVSLDNSRPSWAYGSIQDHGSRRGRLIVSQGRDSIPAQEWVTAPGGEGSVHAIDVTDPNIVFSHGFYGNFTRTNQAAAATRNADRSSPGESGEAGEGGGTKTAGVVAIRPRLGQGSPELRAQWMAPIITSRHDPGVIYAGYQFVFRSSDRGHSWTRISGDLTSNDESRMLLRSSSSIPYQTITALAESPRTKGLLYAGTDDGKLHVTSDDGRTWSDLTSALPTRKWYSRVVPSRHAADTVYVTERGREDDDFGVYVYKSTDRGKTFTSIAANIPAGSVNVIAEDPRNPATLYLGTDFGAFVSTDGGLEWHVLGSGLPTVQVADLAFQARDNVIVIATYGRGMYAMNAMKVR